MKKLLLLLLVTALLNPASLLAEEKSFLVSQEPVTLTAFIHWGNVYVLNDDWFILDEAERLTNVKLKGTASVNDTDSTAAYNLMIAGGDLADLVSGTINNANKYGMEGAFAPLNDLIKEHAPNFAAFLDNNLEVKTGITAPDGNIYIIPFVYELLVSEAWFLRQDWLDKLDLKIPTTLDELHTVLTAFRNDDPNGNGLKDEIPVLDRGTGTGCAEGLLSLWGLNYDLYVDQEGAIQYGRYSDQYKVAIKGLSQWFSEGLIDPEIYTRGGQSREQLFSENNGGCIHDWIPSTTGFNKSMKDVVDGFYLTGFLPVADVNGDVWEVSSRQRMEGIGWSISSACKDPVTAIKYMDFWWTDTGRRLSTYGIEGDTYTLVDGQPVFTDKVLKSGTSVNDYMRSHGGQVNVIAYLHDASYENQMMADPGPEVTKMYADAGVVYTRNKNVPTLSFTEEELDVITSKLPTCVTYMDEMQTKWTFDGSTIDDTFDSYMDTLKGMGMDDVLAAYNSAYARYLDAMEKGK